MGSPPKLLLRANDGSLSFPPSTEPLSLEGNEGLHLPPSLAEAESGGGSGRGELLAVSWQDLHHDEELTSLSLNPTVVVIVDSPQLAERGSSFVVAIDAIRRRFPAALLWTPGIGGPDNCAVLAWMGVDLFDLGRTRRAAASGMLLSGSGVRSADTDAGESDNPDLLVEVGLKEWESSLSTTRMAIQDGRLREIAAAQSISSPRLVEHLRRHDELQRSALDSESSGGGRVGLSRIAAGRRLRCHAVESSGDPIVHDWVSRVVAAHDPPERHRDTLLLLPCSERKPYSGSASHRTMSRAIPTDAVDEISVTSPLGIVPRSLEELWPAAHYDIPVTGKWTEEEINRILILIREVLERFGHQRIVDHSGIVADTGVDFGIEVIDTRKGRRSTDPEALDELSSVLAIRSDGTRVPRPRPRKEILIERFRSISNFLHGSDVWLDGAVVAGKPPRWLIRRGGHQMAQWHPSAGRFAFSKASLPILHRNGMLPRVDLHSGHDWRGDLFSTNVDRWDRSIRVGDEVLVLRDEELMGSARATAPAWEWSGSPGRLARIQHRL